MSKKKYKGEFEDIIKERLGEKTNVSLKDKPKKLSKLEEVDIDESFFQREYRIVNSDSNVEHVFFRNIPVDKRVTAITERGCRVAVAKYPSFYKIYFIKYMVMDSRNYPLGGIKVYNQTYDQVQSFYYDSVAIHPTKKDKCKIYGEE